MMKFIFGCLCLILVLFGVGFLSEYETNTRINKNAEILKEAGFVVVVKDKQCIVNTSIGWKTCDLVLDIMNQR